MGHESVFRSDSRHLPVSPSILQFRIIRDSWLTTFNDGRDQEKTPDSVTVTFSLSDTGLLESSYEKILDMRISHRSR